MKKQVSTSDQTPGSYVHGTVDEGANHNKRGHQKGRYVDAKVKQTLTVVGEDVNQLEVNNKLIIINNNQNN